MVVFESPFAEITIPVDHSRLSIQFIVFPVAFFDCSVFAVFPEPDSLPLSDLRVFQPLPDIEHPILYFDHFAGLTVRKIIIFIFHVNEAVKVGKSFVCKFRQLVKDD